MVCAGDRESDTGRDGRGEMNGLPLREKNFDESMLELIFLFLLGLPVTLVYFKIGGVIGSLSAISWILCLFKLILFPSKTIDINEMIQIENAELYEKYKEAGKQ